MSTQSAVYVPDVPLIDDKPPAGTPCLPCKKLGHWCPAAKYIGQTDDGICKDCAAEENCPVAARKKAKDYGDVFDLPPEPAPVRHIAPPTKQEQYEAARTDHARKALAGEYGRDALKTPITAQPKAVKATPPVVKVPSYMGASGRKGRPFDLAEARKLYGTGLGLKQIAGKFGIGVARLRRELGSVKEVPKVLTGIPKAILEKRVIINPVVDLSAEILVPAFAPRKPLFEAIDDVIAHLEAEMASIRATVEMLKARRGTT